MIELNRVKNVVIHPIGLGNENSNLPFYQPSSDNLGTGSFARDFSAKNTPVGSLPIRRGHDVLGNAHIGPVTLVKMDYRELRKTGPRGAAPDTKRASAGSSYSNSTRRRGILFGSAAKNSS